MKFSGTEWQKSTSQSQAELDRRVACPAAQLGPAPDCCAVCCLWTFCLSSQSDQMTCITKTVDWSPRLRKGALVNRGAASPALHTSSQHTFLPMKNHRKMSTKRGTLCFSKMDFMCMSVCLHECLCTMDVPGAMDLSFLSAFCGPREV